MSSVHKFATLFNMRDEDSYFAQIILKVGI